MMNFLKDMLLGRVISRDAYQEDTDFGWSLIYFILMLVFSYICLATVWEVNFS